MNDCVTLVQAGPAQGHTPGKASQVRPVQGVGEGGERRIGVETGRADKSGEGVETGRRKGVARDDTGNGRWQWQGSGSGGVPLCRQTHALFGPPPSSCLFALKCNYFGRWEAGLRDVLGVRFCHPALGTLGASFISGRRQYLCRILTPIPGLVGLHLPN